MVATVGTGRDGTGQDGTRRDGTGRDGTGQDRTGQDRTGTDLGFVKKFTQPNFRAKEVYTLKTRKSRLFSPAINSKNASLSVI